MSDIFFRCTACGKYLVVDDDGAGVTTQCPACDASIIIPDMLLVDECPHCKQTVKAAGEMKGELVRCSSCRGRVRLPGQPQLVGK